MGAIGRAEGEGGARVSIINFGSRYRRAARDYSRKSLEIAPEFTLSTAAPLQPQPHAASALQ